eukprot:1083046-Prymnesium_polylepis.1
MLVDESAAVAAVQRGEVCPQRRLADRARAEPEVAHEERAACARQARDAAAAAAALLVSVAHLLDKPLEARDRHARLRGHLRQRDAVIAADRAAERVVQRAAADAGAGEGADVSGERSAEVRRGKAPVGRGIERFLAVVTVKEVAHERATCRRGPAPLVLAVRTHDARAIGDGHSRLQLVEARQQVGAARRERHANARREVVPLGPKRAQRAARTERVEHAGLYVISAM